MTKEELAVGATFLVAELRKEIARSVKISVDTFLLWPLQKNAVQKLGRQRRKHWE